MHLFSVCSCFKNSLTRRRLLHPEKERLTVPYIKHTFVIMHCFDSGWPRGYFSTSFYAQSTWHHSQRGTQSTSFKHFCTLRGSKESSSLLMVSNDVVVTHINSAYNTEGCFWDKLSYNFYVSWTVYKGTSLPFLSTQILFSALRFPECPSCFSMCTSHVNGVN